MLQIDGSMGEGGGQVLRSALALSILSSQPVHLTNVRAKRDKPGLQPQHLKSVEAAAAICGGQVQGAMLNSQELIFEPGEVHSGRYRFDIGTAGSTSLVLQTVFLPLSRGKDSSTLTITGGTHVPFSPSYHYLERQWLPTLQTLGFWARISLEQAGFYPKGGGEIRAQIRPVKEIQPFNTITRGRLRRIRGITAAANLDADIAKRQKLQALRRLEPVCRDSKIETIDLPSISKGTMLLLQAEFELPDGQTHTCCYFGLGAIGKRAERVADEAVDALVRFLATDGVVDEFLADQLILPLSFASGTSQLRTACVTRHLLTQVELVQMFIPVKITVDGEENQPGTVTIQP